MNSCDWLNNQPYDYIKKEGVNRFQKLLLLNESETAEISNKRKSITCYQVNMLWAPYADAVFQSSPETGNGEK